MRNNVSRITAKFERNLSHNVPTLTIKVIQIDVCIMYL
jgi:hypothetical protein